MQTFNYEGQRVLILAPHADDETIGCGGVIQKYVKSQSPVRVVIASFVTATYKKYKAERKQYELYSGSRRLKELSNAFQILGITDHDFLYLEQSENIRYHSKLDTVPRVDLVTAIERHIQDFQPTVVYIPSKTKHQDHETLHAVALTATRPYFWSGSVVVYETDGEFDFAPNFYVPLTTQEMTTKTDAMSAFQTQVGSERHPVNPQALIHKASYRGQFIYSDYAEAFQILRLHG